MFVCAGNTYTHVYIILSKKNLTNSSINNQMVKYHKDKSNRKQKITINKPNVMYSENYI